MALNNTPGIYINEIPGFPPSIAQVETAVPVFIGYTEKAQYKEPDDLIHKPFCISSLLQYEQQFGFPRPEKEGVISVSVGNGSNITANINEQARSKFLMHYSMQMFFGNGGGKCWIISVGDYTNETAFIDTLMLKAGLSEAATIQDATLIVFPDAINIATAAEYYDLYTRAIDQCATLQDRIVIMDVHCPAGNMASVDADIDLFRNTIQGNPDKLQYAAAYYPKIYTAINYKVDDAAIRVVGLQGADTLEALKLVNNALYFKAKNTVANIGMLLPVSPAMAGIYAQVDRNRGVWKAPANISINYAVKTQLPIDDNQQEKLNIDTDGGKSINAIRFFAGKGVLVWGARTLAGNNNEWRYINVRRFFIMVEMSIKNSTGSFVFEPNDKNTWVKVKGMIENFLILQWRSGALAGAKPEEAFYVKVGLNETMTAIDVLEGRMIVELGMAVTRPAEFITLRFMMKMMAEF